MSARSTRPLAANTGEAVRVRSARRALQCYHCRGAFDVGVKAIKLTCPVCYKPIDVQDLWVTGSQSAGIVRTCGALVVAHRATLRAEHVEARLGVNVQGRLCANVASGGPVIIGPRAVWEGDCEATGLLVLPGAVIVGGRFQIVPPATRG